MKEKKPLTYAEKVQKALKRSKVIPEPLVLGLIEDLHRIEEIQGRLYIECQNGDMLIEYINKSGNSNIVINPVIKEYKAYSQQRNTLIKSLYPIIKEILPIVPTELDPLAVLNGRDRK
ncbi:MAG: hypothetical protein H7Y41_06875 [Hyphomonadaceae bacterium]|nr:hypothetical protein [Clostridia bacterium]